MLVQAVGSQRVFDQGTEAERRKPYKKVAQGEVVRPPWSGIE